MLRFSSQLVPHRHVDQRSFRPWPPPLCQGATVYGDLIPLLGIRRGGLLPACAYSLVLTATLFLGPLLWRLLLRPAPPKGRRSSSGGSPVARVSALGDLRMWRNYVMAPLTEEFVFRACMAPVLRLEVRPAGRVVPPTHVAESFSCCLHFPPSATDARAPARFLRCLTPIHTRI